MARKKQAKPAEPKAEAVYGKSLAEIKAERDKPAKTTTMVTS